MNILGVVAYTLGYGESCAALAVNGEIVGVVEEERFTRIRYEDGFPSRAIASLLDQAGITGRDVDVVTLQMSPWRGILNRVAWMLRHPVGAALNSWSYFQCGVSYGGMRRRIEQALGSSRFVVESPGHHESHAAAAFETSPFERAAFLTLDGAGEALTGSIGAATRAGGVEMLKSFSYPHSLGLAYSAVGDHIGFPPPAGPGKVMGLAAYGDPERHAALFREMMGTSDAGLRLNLRYFQFHRNLSTPLDDKPWMSALFERALGLPRRRRDAPLEQAHMDVAAALQRRTNEIGLEMAEKARAMTGMRHLCLGGGVALNSVMNAHIEENSGFQAVHIQPAAGDSGNTIGGIYLAARKRGQPIKALSEMPYVGPGYDDRKVEEALRAAGIAYAKSHDVAAEAAEAIKAGAIVGWFQGRMEYGPRALGNRSILADPQRLDMKDYLNDRVKHREWFRPFAPAVVKEAFSTYFEGSEDNEYMLKVAWVREPWRGVFPAITHADGSARVQIVRRERNPKYYRLIQLLGEINRHPMVLNTSFNDREPIVCTPEDAVGCFARTNIDVLCINDFIARKAA